MTGQLEISYTAHVSPQCEAIRDYLDSHDGITDMEAFDFHDSKGQRWHITSLHRRLADMRKAGYAIDKGTWEVNELTGKRYKRYRWITED